MGIHSRHTRILALVGVLALGAASAARAQDTSSVQSKDTSASARSDTSGYKSYQNSDTMRSDTAHYKYNGPPTDTTLKAKPGVQTGRNADSSARSSSNQNSNGQSGRIRPTDSTAAGMAGNAGATDSMVCKDGSRAVTSACDAEHGGVDSVATRAAKKARGQAGASDTVYTSQRDTSETK
jgi:hypothetical protein